MIEYSRDSWLTLASVWIIRYCYSCGASCSTLPRAMCKSWMTAKKSEWQANGLLWEREEALWGEAAHCLRGDIFDNIAAHCWVAFLFFLFFFLYATISEPIQITPRPHERELYVFCYLTCFQPDGVGGLEKAISLRLFPSIVFTSQGTIALYYVTWPKLGHTHTQSIFTHMRPRRHESSLDVPPRRIIAII